MAWSPRRLVAGAEANNNFDTRSEDEMTCQTCRLKRACKSMGGLCPYLLYLVLAVVVAIPGYFLYTLVSHT